MSNVYRIRIEGRQRQPARREEKERNFVPTQFCVFIHSAEKKKTKKSQRRRPSKRKRNEKKAFNRFKLRLRLFCAFFCCFLKAEENFYKANRKIYCFEGRSDKFMREVNANWVQMTQNEGKHPTDRRVLRCFFNGKKEGEKSFSMLTMCLPDWQRRKFIGARMKFESYGMRALW